MPDDDDEYEGGEDIDFVNPLNDSN